MSKAPSTRFLRAFLFTLCALCALLSAAVARAEDAWTVRTSNLRAGPDYSYPVVTRIPAGAVVGVAGCVDGYSWCDVVAGPERGWMHARNLEYAYDGSRVVVYGHPYVGFPVVTYAVGPYWDAYYVGRPWYGRRAYWVAHPVIPPPLPHPHLAHSAVAHPVPHAAHAAHAEPAHAAAVEAKPAPAHHGAATEHTAPKAHAAPAPHAKAPAGKHGHS
jgi:uncharacterized protein YraI